MFGNLMDPCNEKIKSINSKIEKAQNEINKIQNSLNIDMDVEEYSSSSLKIDTYKNYIEECKAKIKEIEKNPFSSEDVGRICEKVADAYNPRLKKAYKEVLKQSKALCEAIEAYRKIGQEVEAYSLEYVRYMNMIDNSYRSPYDLVPGVRNEYSGYYYSFIDMLKYKEEEYPLKD